MTGTRLLSCPARVTKSSRRSDRARPLLSLSPLTRYTQPATLEPSSRAPLATGLLRSLLSTLSDLERPTEVARAAPSGIADSTLRHSVNNHATTLASAKAVQVQVSYSTTSRAYSAWYQQHVVDPSSFPLSDSRSAITPNSTKTRRPLLLHLAPQCWH